MTINPQDAGSDVAINLLIEQIDALVALDEANALVPHGFGGHARELLKRTRAALTQEKIVAAL